MTPINITVKSTSGSRYEMEITEMAETISDFKVRLSEVSGIEAASQRLIFRGHILKDHLTFEDIRSKHGLESGHSMHVVSAPSKSSAPSSTNTQATPATNTTSTPSATTPNSTNDNTTSNRPSQQPMPNPFTAGIGGGGGGGLGMGGGFPDMNEMQAQLRQNPEQMQAMLNHPMMESIMNNPELMRSFMMANPQIRQMMEQNPEMAHVFNDPATFRQMMQMARNPSLMSEMMRNTDRQMANIEMMPGGFDALRRMHENIQAPLMDAAQAGFGANTTPQNNSTNNNNNNNNNNDSANDNPFSTLFQNNNTPSNAPMPNPWAPTNNNGGSYNNNNNNDNNAANTNTNGAGFLDNPFASLFPGMGAGTGAGAGTGMDTGTNTGANTNANNANTGTRGMPGLPNFGANGGAATDAMMDLLDSPAVQQMMQHVLADPAILRSMMEGNPQMQTLVRENPQLAATLENPDLLRSLFNPEVLRAARQLQNAMGTQGGQQATGFGQQTPQQQPTPTPTGENNTSTNTNNNNNNNPNNGADRLEQMMQMFRNQLGTDGNFNNNNNNNNGQPQPEPSQEELLESYRPQLSQLRDMGFLDESMCLQALRQARGDVSLAIENLLNRFG